MKPVTHLNGRTFQHYQSTSISIILSPMSYTTECITSLELIIQVISQVVETSGTMLGEFQLGI